MHGSVFLLKTWYMSMRPKLCLRAVKLSLWSAVPPVKYDVIYFGLMSHDQMIENERNEANFV